MMETSGLPFDDIRNLAGQMPAVDAAAAGRVRALLERQPGLGRVEDLACWFSAATGRAPARVGKAAVALFAATHAVSRRQGVADPVEAARERVEEIASGAAPLSQICAASDLGLNVFDLALDLPVEDITQCAALDERGAAATMAFGMEAVAVGADLLCLGTVDSAADISAMAVLCALGHSSAEDWGGSAGLVSEALRTHERHLRDPLEVARRLGGREIAALCGAILAARTQKVAVLLDGLPALAASAVLRALNPAALDHCLLADVHDKAQGRSAERLGLVPLLAFGTSGSAGIAAALAVDLVRSAAAVSAGMAEVHARSARG